ncbi:MAG TPA: hypothetical protein VGQ02_10800 [Candidatus Limnocylindrales bacterium]|jgi:hypothetical protein|nr:hypothetical protein [Candidatus Limnocylindrales bacterium]
MIGPKYTPKSELSLSAGPEELPVPSGPVAVLRSERDPLTPALIRELADVCDCDYSRGNSGGRCVECGRYVYASLIPESELRALWGDR